MNSAIIVAISVIGGVIALGLLIFGLRELHKWFQKRAQIKAREAFTNTHTTHLRGNFVQHYTHNINDDYDMYLDQELGRGGCGFVVVAESMRSNEQFAIKIVDKHAMERGRIDREINLLKDVDHPNIIRLFSVYDSPKRVCLVMELCLGGHLGNLCARQVPKKCLDEAWARILTKQLVSAVAHLHTRGIAHRDIKMQNILIDSSNDRNAQIKLIDFGFSARFVGCLPMRTKVGTPYTTAPEVLRECYDERCDVWSVGVCVYILLTGKKPFDNLQLDGPLAEAGRTAMLTNILAGRYSVAELTHPSRGLSRECVSFVQALLHKDYKNRVTAAEVLKLPWLYRDSNESSSNSNIQKSSSISRLTNMLSKSSFTSGKGTTTTINSPVISNSNAKVLKSEKSKSAFKTLMKSVSRNDLQRTGAMALVFSYQPRQATNMRVLFQSCDLDGSGALTPDEFEKAITTIIPGLTPADSLRIFHNIDVNGDGQVTYSEFLAATLDPETIDIEQLNKAFRLLDDDGNGFITADELRKVLTVKATTMVVPSPLPNPHNQPRTQKGGSSKRMPSGRFQWTNSFKMTRTPSNNNNNKGASSEKQSQKKGASQRQPSARTAAKNMKEILQAVSPADEEEQDGNGAAAGNTTARADEASIEERVNAIVAAFDINNDGVISYDEFLMAMTGNTDLIGLTNAQQQAREEHEHEDDLDLRQGQQTLQTPSPNSMLGHSHRETQEIEEVASFVSELDAAVQAQERSKPHVVAPAPSKAKAPQQSTSTVVPMVWTQTQTLTHTLSQSQTNTQESHIRIMSASSTNTADTPRNNNNNGVNNNNNSFVSVASTKSNRSIKSNKSNKSNLINSARQKDHDVIGSNEPLSLNMHSSTIMPGGTVIFKPANISTRLQQQQQQQQPSLSSAGSYKVVNVSNNTLNNSSNGSMDAEGGGAKIDDDDKLDKEQQKQETAIITNALLSASGKSSLIWSKGILLQTTPTAAGAVASASAATTSIKATSLATGSTSSVDGKSAASNKSSSGRSVARMKLGEMEFQELEDAGGGDSTTAGKYSAAAPGAGGHDDRSAGLVLGLAAPLSSSPAAGGQRWKDSPDRYSNNASASGANGIAGSGNENGNGNASGSPAAVAAVPSRKIAGAGAGVNGNSSSSAAVVEQEDDNGSGSGVLMRGLSQLMKGISFRSNSAAATGEADAGADLPTGINNV